MTSISPPGPKCANDNPAQAPGSAGPDLRAIRKLLGFSREHLADVLGMPVGELATLETGQGRMSIVVALALEALALHLAVSREDPTLAPAGVQQDALALARLLDQKPLW